MPSLKKKAISLYFRTKCKRQLALNLYNDPERRANGMPERQQVRPGLGLIGEAGYEWQEEKVNELGDIFGKDAVHINPRKRGNQPLPLDLLEILPIIKPYQFIVEAEYVAATQVFMDVVGISVLKDSAGRPLDVGDARPDLIQVLPPAATPMDGESVQQDSEPVATMLAVQPNGDVIAIASTDQRLRLRVIDIKLAAEPGSHYFAEVVYYSITLAAWLKEHKQDHTFVVVAAPAVWPGSYDASHIRQVHNQCNTEGRVPTAEELARALQGDIEIAPFDVFAPRLRRFFQTELPQVLQTPWNKLQWHVSYRCSGCEFLGFPWGHKDGNVAVNPLHCWPEAEATGHLSRVAGLSIGGARLLRDYVPNVKDLASLSPDDQLFERSPTLRAKRTVYPHRAQALESSLTKIIPDSGSDALMPRWPDLHIYIFLDYDLATAITATFSIRAFWREPIIDLPLKRKSIRWSAWNGTSKTNFHEVYLVDRRELGREREELLKFLRTLHNIISAVRQQDKEDIEAERRGDVSRPDKLKRSTYQIYLWDEAQRKHLTRVIGRHLPAILSDSSLRDLAWLFPSPELLAHAEDASYNSPFTLVSNVVQNTVAVPVPHHYILLDVAKTYRPATTSELSVHPLYREPLSDLIPGERLHEMWTKRGNYTETQRTIEETTAKKLSALSYVVAQLEQDLRNLLQRAAAPPLDRPARGLRRLPAQSMLWYEYTRLNQAIEKLEEHTLRAMPAHEREARFKSARLLERLHGAAKTQACILLQNASEQLLDSNALLIYQLNRDSYDFSVRPPALGYALAPRADPSFLGQSAYPLVLRADVTVEGKLAGSVADAGLTKVSVVAIDRVNGLIALKPWLTNCVLDLEAAGIADFRTDVMLDPVGDDFLSKKLRFTLQGIGYPESAGIDEDADRALGLTSTRPDSPAPETPASEFLWQAPSLTTKSVVRDVINARRRLELCGTHLNESQWAAWEAALTRRLTLIWGPPGTGKSQTLKAIISATAWAATHHKQPLRLLIASNNYTAIDNLLLDVDTLLAQVVGAEQYQLFRLQSQYNAPPAELRKHPHIKPVIVKTTLAPQEVLALQTLLTDPQGTMIVASPPQQLHNLAIATKNKTKKETAERTQQRWFDLLIIDEASQLGVAEATLVVSKAADNATFVLAGDDKQLPPIQPADPPERLEHVVGSVYNYIRHHHSIDPYPLQVNYRSCKTLVDFTKCAGYDPRLHAYHPELRLTPLSDGFPTQHPANWPEELYWTSEWIHLLNPMHPAVCFIYDDDVSGHSNAFEADTVAALIWILYGRLDQQLTRERHGDTFAALTGQAHNEIGFWERNIGVVTPHLAQMSKIVSRIQSIFPAHSPTSIRNAVDTVERFQGQQRDVILASFGLGDTDLIGSEDEFLYSLNRFNVLASRARAKLIVLLTRSLLDHLADDARVLQESRLLKNYAETFCQSPTLLQLGYKENGTDILKPGVLRVR